MENKGLRIVSVGSVVIPHVFSGIYQRKSVAATEWKLLVNPTSSRKDTSSTPILVQPTDITRYVQNTSIYKNYCIF
jgi:allophanate hydrolase subunit 1